MHDPAQNRAALVAQNILQFPLLPISNAIVICLVLLELNDVISTDQKRKGACSLSVTSLWLIQGFSVARLTHFLVCFWIDHRGQGLVAPKDLGLKDLLLPLVFTMYSNPAAYYSVSTRGWRRPSPSYLKL